MAERPGDPLGDARFAVAGGPEQKQTAAGIDGRAEAAEHGLVDQQVGKRALQIGGLRMLGRQRLGRDAGDIVFQHDRSRAEVGASIGQAAGTLVPGFGQLINVIVHQRRAFVNDQLFGFQLRQHLLDEQKRQLQLIGDLPPAGVAARGQQLDQQRFDFALGQLALRPATSAPAAETRTPARQGLRRPPAPADRLCGDSLEPLQQLFQFAVSGRGGRGDRPPAASRGDVASAGRSPAVAGRQRRNASAIVPTFRSVVQPSSIIPAGRVRVAPIAPKL